MSKPVRNKIILYDLPVFPKGVISLSLVNVATCLGLGDRFEVEIVDLNFLKFEHYKLTHSSPETLALFGLKVSSQNYYLAQTLSQKLRHTFPNVKIVWGGEFPSLLPDRCLPYADSVVTGQFDTVYETLLDDLESENLSPRYNGQLNYDISHLPTPDFSYLNKRDAYYSFMGLPMETSRGCTENCFFCMKHVMQRKNYYIKSPQQIEIELSSYAGRYINIVDYNFGVNKEHVLATAERIKKSKALGWMAEMCIELLDDDEILIALRESRCKIIYCGLETIEENALESVNKQRTNHVENYERIIKKVQSYGVQIGAGIILGIEGTHEKTFDNLYSFFVKNAIVYAKLTFLVYNPGTRIHKHMEQKGTYLSDDLHCFDGNHLSYLPSGVSQEVVFDGTVRFIKKFYSFNAILKRALKHEGNVAKKLEFVLFNLCYRDAYLKWVEYKVFENNDNFKKLLEAPFTKSRGTKLAELALNYIRKNRF